VRAQKEMIRGRLDADRKTSSRPIKERFIELEKRETEATRRPRRSGSYMDWNGYHLLDPAHYF
jgi:hypothetical protein